MNLFQIGINESMDDSVKRKIYLTNIFVLILSLLIVVYSIISIFLVPEILPYIGSGLLLYLSVFLLNKLEQYTLAKIVISIAPVYVVAVLHALLLAEDKDYNYSIYVFQVIAMAISWTIFNIKEVPYMALTSAVNIYPIFFFQHFRTLFKLEADTSFFGQNWVQVAVLLGAITMLFFIVFFLQVLQSQSDKKAKDFKQQVDEQNAESAKKQEELEASLKELELSREEEKKRTWATEGIAKISGILRAENNLERLSDEVIAFVVKYIGANQGALFVINDDEEDNKFIEMKACYAYERKKFIDKQIKIGQGLVGQSFLEKDFIYLKEIPQDYTFITSGLGGATPNTLLVAPMIINEQVYGIFEIASFKEIEPHQIAFVMELGETIATALSSVKINERTKRLLEESQEQTEQMRAQEEEMRQNMEEMQATQENQYRLQSELDIKQKQLQEKIRSAEVFNQALAAFRKNRNLVKGELEAGLKDLTEAITEAMQVSRASVWAYMPDEEKIVALDLHELVSGKHSSGTELFKKDFPDYFRAVENEKTIQADSARVHPDTKGFTEVYFKPLDIFSLLDVPFFVAGKLGGVICLEHQQEERVWTAEEVSFITSACDLLTILYQNHHIKHMG